jgi:hypothetical protein
LGSIIKWKTEREKNTPSVPTSEIYQEYTVGVKTASLTIYCLRNPCKNDRKAQYH